MKIKTFFKKLWSNVEFTKPTIYILFIIPFLILFIKGWHMDNDVWFLFAQGKYVLSHGFPYTDPLSIHSNFSFVMQQWLSCIMFWLIYKNFGVLGIFIYVITINILIIYSLYKLCMIISERNTFISVLITTIIDSLIIYFGYLASRPQILSYLMLILFILVIEKYLKTGNYKTLLFLFPISLLEVNLHASTWWFLYILSFPYLIEVLYKKFVKKERNIYDWRFFVTFLVIAFYFGFLNPYGTKALTYFWLSNNSYVVKYVSEMIQPSIFNIRYVITMILFFVLFIANLKDYKKSDKVKLNYILLLFGTFLLAAMSYKSMIYFYIFAVFPLAYYLKNINKNVKYIKIDELKIGNKILYLDLLILLISLCGFYGVKNVNLSSDNWLKRPVTYLLNNYNKKNISTYSDYDNGGFLEYNGIKSYIDPRAEVFYKSINNSENVFEEYYFLQTSETDINAFILKYNFTHLVIVEGDRLYNKLNNDNYVLEYVKNGVKIYARKDVSIKYNETYCKNINKDTY